jgi:hypothetical protein
MAELCKLIQCGDHGWAPWSLVCVHLVDGAKARKRLRFVLSDANPIHPEGNRDALCLTCFENGVFNKPAEELFDLVLPICLECGSRVLSHHEEVKDEED